MQIQEIIDTYKQTESLRETAVKCSVNWQKVRKILITTGLYESDMSVIINRMHKQGKSLDSIALELNMSKTAVNSYLPYKKGVYNLGDPTENAIRIRACRERKSNSTILHEDKLHELHELKQLK